MTADLGSGIIHHSRDDGGDLVRTSDAVYRHSDSTACGPWLALGPEQIEMELGTARPLAIEPLTVLQQSSDLSDPTISPDGSSVYEATVPSRLAVRGEVVGGSRLSAMRSPLTVTATADGSTVTIEIDSSEAFRVMARGMQPDVVSTTTWTVRAGAPGPPPTVPSEVVEDPDCQAVGPRKMPVKPTPTNTTTTTEP